MKQQTREQRQHPMLDAETKRLIRSEQERLTVKTKAEVKAELKAEADAKARTKRYEAADSVCRWAQTYMMGLDSRNTGEIMRSEKGLRDALVTWRAVS